MRSLILYGAGGHARVVADLFARLDDYSLVGIVDDDVTKLGRRVGTAEVLGGSGLLASLRAQGVDAAHAALGRNQERRSKGQQLRQLGFELVSAVHPSATLGLDVVVGAGSAIFAGAVVNTGSRIGESVVVNTGATVDHDCLLADGCHLSPGAHLAGNVYVGEEAHVGIGSSVIQNIRIGARSIVGAGAVVIRDIPTGETWVGNPARLLRTER